MRFGRVREAFAGLRTIFNGFDDNRSGAIDREELEMAMRALGASSIRTKDVDSFFSCAQFSEENELNFREFIVALSLASVLHFLPDLRAYADTDMSSARKIAHISEEASDAKKDEEEWSGGGEVGAKDDASSANNTRSLFASLHARGKAIVDALRVVVEAYMIFDRDGDGTIDREEVMSILGAAEGSSDVRRVSTAGATEFLSQDRWRQLDWDGDGKVTFREFVHAFIDWVGVDEEEDEDEEVDQELVEAIAAAKRAHEAEAHIAKD